MHNMRPEWRAPRMVVQGHVREVVAINGVGKNVYGPDADALKGEQGKEGPGPNPNGPTPNGPG